MGTDGEARDRRGFHRDRHRLADHQPRFTVLAVRASEIIAFPFETQKDGERLFADLFRTRFSAGRRASEKSNVTGMTDRDTGMGRSYALIGADHQPALCPFVGTRLANGHDLHAQDAISRRRHAHEMELIRDAKNICSTAGDCPGVSLLGGFTLGLWGTDVPLVFGRCAEREHAEQGGKTERTKEWAGLLGKHKVLVNRQYRKIHATHRGRGKKACEVIGTRCSSNSG